MNSYPKTKKILFVCLGNICRSPAAECIFSKMLAESAPDSGYSCDSAGTTGFHEGSPPDARMTEVLESRGYSTFGRSRALSRDDFFDFDLILSMDQSVHQTILSRAPANCREKVRSFTEFCHQSKVREIPDPYYGGTKGFAHVMDLLEEGCRHLLESEYASREQI